MNLFSPDRWNPVSTLLEEVGGNQLCHVNDGNDIYNLKSAFTLLPFSMFRLFSPTNSIGRRASTMMQQTRTARLMSHVVVTMENDSSPSPFRTDIVVNDKHELVADEPSKVGGSDLGPSPYELLLSALGSCTVMTLRMYADRRSLPLTGVSVKLSHNKVHKKDCEECMMASSNKSDSNKSTSPIFDRIQRDIVLSGENLMEADRRRLMEIADKCPVHRTLEQGQVVVVSSLLEQAEP